MFRRHVLALSALALIACAGAQEEAALCEVAAVHARDCGMGEFAITTPEGCDTERAEELVGSSCAQLTSAAKEDSLVSSFLCSLGFLQSCPVPTCDGTDGPTTTSEATTAGLCAELLDDESCRSCAYYTCRDAESACPGGYFASHAFKYCERLSLVAAPAMSPQGQVWLSEARACLMRVAEESIANEASCEALANQGFASHPVCYLEAGFCDLPISDWLVLLSAIDSSDLRFRDVLDTGLGCLGDF